MPLFVELVGGPLDGRKLSLPDVEPPREIPFMTFEPEALRVSNAEALLLPGAIFYWHRGRRIVGPGQAVHLYEYGGERGRA